MAKFLKKLLGKLLKRIRCTEISFKYNNRLIIFDHIFWVPKLVKSRKCPGYGPAVIQLCCMASN